jgi:hypothetical protein
MQQYLSASTAKGMMLRNELQSMMAMPQGAVPAPSNPQGYVQQVYYGPGAVVRSGRLVLLSVLYEYYF